MEFARTFAGDVDKGLSATPKYLLSKYFYDAAGDEIFQKIMEMPEYYPTDCEFEIFDSGKEDLMSLFNKDCKSFDLIEFGAGDGKKTKVLISYFLEKKARFKYFPIDISENVISQLSRDLKDSFHCINFEGQVGDYFEKLNALMDARRCRKVILFLGSNLGNFVENEAIDFLRQIASNMNPQDYLLIGLDLKKDPSVILDAYNDPAGITRDFNLNLLTRMNRELGADFIVDNFIHFPIYDPLSGAAKSYLVSKVEQKVFIRDLNKTYYFREWEAIFTEVSQKYDLQDINRLAERSGMRVIRSFYDKKHYFVDSLWALKA